MNIVISLDCSAELVTAIVEDIQNLLSTHGFGTQSAAVGNINALHCCHLAAPNETDVAAEPTSCGICGSEPCACPTVDDSPVDSSYASTDQGITAMVQLPPLNTEVPGINEPASEPSAQPEAAGFGDVRVLTLSTSFHIPSSPVGTNTTLKTTGRILSDGVVRFTYNGFEHALPVADMADKSIVNIAHVSGPSTVRLVIDIANKTYACLVDIDGGDKEELLIGDDLINVLKEPVENVPAE